MAVVYLAYDPNFHRNVAIKRVSGNFQHDTAYRERFKREARLIARIEHPAIVPVYDYGEEHSQLYLVMRHMPGGSLTEKIKGGVLTLGYVTQVISQIAPALDAVHSQGIVHRDLKPGNILFDGFGNPAISDFGIAHFTTATSDLTGSAVIGTPSYMSPEQVRADADLDGRSDIYALGVIIFEMLTGRGPYHANTPMSVALKHLTDPVPAIQSLRPDLPSELETILGKVLAKDRAVRYAKASELASALRSLPEASNEAGTHANVRVAAARGDDIPTEVDVEDAVPSRSAPRFEADLQPASPAETSPPSAPGAAHKPPARGTLRIATLATAGLTALVVCGVIALLATWAGLNFPGLASGSATPATLPAPTILFSDDFSNPNSGWPSGETSYGEFGYQTGAYRILAIGNGSVPWVSRDEIYEDVSLQAEATPISGNGYYGLLCRIQNDGNFYYFVLGSDGTYEIGKFKDGQALVLFADGARYSDLIRQGDQTNRIRVDCAGSTLRLYANDVLLGEATDTDFRAGQGGMSVSASGSNFEVVFDNVLITTTP